MVLDLVLLFHLLKLDSLQRFENPGNQLHRRRQFHDDRIIVKLGLKGLVTPKSPGLRAILEVADLVIVTAPIGLGLGRLGNFINAELIGRPSSVPWAVVFPTGGQIPRHPSQLYEALLEGVVLFIILWQVKDVRMKPGGLLCLFLGGYGIFRFIVEFFRQPDPQLGLLWGFLSMGQILCLAMVLAAGILWILLPTHQK